MVCASRRNCCSLFLPKPCRKDFNATVRPMTVSRALSTRLVAPQPRVSIISYRPVWRVGLMRNAAIEWRAHENWCVVSVAASQSCGGPMDTILSPGDPPTDNGAQDLFPGTWQQSRQIPSERMDLLEKPEEASRREPACKFPAANRNQRGACR